MSFWFYGSLRFYLVSFQVKYRRCLQLAHSFPTDSSAGVQFPLSVGCRGGKSPQKFQNQISFKAIIFQFLSKWFKQRAVAFPTLIISVEQSGTGVPHQERLLASELTGIPGSSIVQLKNITKGSSLVVESSHFLLCVIDACATRSGLQIPPVYRDANKLAYGCFTT